MAKYSDGLLDRLYNKEIKISKESKLWEDILNMYKGCSCGKSAMQTAIEENEKCLREITELPVSKLKLPKVKTYTKPDGTRVKRAIASVHPYVPAFFPWFDTSPPIRYAPEKFLLCIDLAEDPDRINIQVKRKHNKLKFNFNN